MVVTFKTLYNLTLFGPYITWPYLRPYNLHYLKNHLFSYIPAPPLGVLKRLFYKDPPMSQVRGMPTWGKLCGTTTMEQSPRRTAKFYLPHNFQRGLKIHFTFHLFHLFVSFHLFVEWLFWRTVLGLYIQLIPYPFPVGLSSFSHWILLCFDISLSA